MAMLIYRRDWIRCNSLADIFEDGNSRPAPRSTTLVRSLR